MKKLRSGYTTGACAAAAAKGAILLLLTKKKRQDVEIPFPDGKRHSFLLESCDWTDPLQQGAQAVVIKDAGDDPDVTNGAAIVVEACFVSEEQGQEGGSPTISITAGEGVGRVTKPGLAVPVGQPAINPMPQQMIREAASEALVGHESSVRHPIRLTVSIPKGRELAERTLNHRLGIVGGLSILGTTGIVRPVSADAWTATITTSMDVAKEAGLKEIVLSTGRTSEVAVQKRLALPQEAYVMMGDYLHYSLTDAAKHGFSIIHFAGMWAKILKAAMQVPQTHVRHGALEVEKALLFLADLGIEKNVRTMLEGANTAREIYERLADAGCQDVIFRVCQAAAGYATTVSGLPVAVYLVHSSKTVVAMVPAVTATSP